MEIRFNYYAITLIIQLGSTTLKYSNALDLQLFQISTHVTIFCQITLSLGI